MTNKLQFSRINIKLNFYSSFRLYVTNLKCQKEADRTLYEYLKMSRFTFDEITKVVSQPFNS